MISGNGNAQHSTLPFKPPSYFYPCFHTAPSRSHDGLARDVILSRKYEFPVRLCDRNV